MITNPKIPDLLSSLDYIIFFIIIFITIGFVFYGHIRKPRKMDESESFLDIMLMGRKLTLPMFVMTLVATWYGGIFGVSQMAYEYGIFNFITQGFFWYVTYIIFALFLIKKIKNYEALTLPDLISQMFGPKSGKVAAFMNILNLIPIAYTISLGLFLNMIFKIPLEYGIVFGVCFVLLYSFFGGLRSVVYSDIFQFFVMISAVFAVFLIGILKFQFSPLENLPKHYFSPLSKFSIGETLAWGFIALSTLVDPNFYQRCFAAESFKTAKKGILIATVIWFCFDLSLTAGAMYAKALLPEADPKYGYFYYALQILPEGMRGFFLAGICATILSTLDSYIFLAGSTLSYDLVPNRWKGKVSIHHIGILIVTIISVGLSFVFDGNIKNVWKTLGSLSSAALLIPVLYGHLTKQKLSDTIFLTSSGCGALGVIFWRLGGFKDKYQLDEIYIGMALAILGILSIKIIRKESF